MMRMGDSSETYAKRSIVLAPDYAFAHIFYAWLPIIYNGDIKEASDRIEQGLTMTDLTASKYYWWLIRIIKKDGLTDFDEIVTQGTDSLAYYKYLAQMNRLNGNHHKEKIYADSILSFLEKKIEQSPNDPKFNSALGLAYAGLRDKEKALFYGRKALEFAPTSREAVDAPFLVMDFAEILMIFDQNEDAIEQLKFLISIPGFVSTAYYEVDPLWKPLFEDKSVEEVFQKLQ
jgi:tetratricopeptide (TPR) repeat protein